LEAFDGDNSLIKDCEEMMKFYKDEAENQIPVMIEFHLKKEYFENVKAAFDKMSKKERTQEKVDEFNKAVNEFNESVNKLNKVNDETNAKRAELIDSWNKSTSKFTASHVK
jgi:hypothetical protein